jgi:N-acetylglucosamine kinase-like BadF-type ATPase
MSRSTLVLGIDGGGTKTTALVADEQGNILAERQGKATNPNVVGHETAARTIHQLVTLCCDDVRCEPPELRSMVFGLAGVGRDPDRRRIREEVTKLFEGEKLAVPAVSVETDARIALEGAFAGGPGVVMIAGTGSIVVGKTLRGDVLRVGGWGRMIGDEGSGYAIGREALAVLALHHDGRGDSGRLREAFAREFKWESRDQIIAAIYQEHVDPATLAPLVIQTAGNNCVVAQHILQRAATLLVEQARIVVMQMGILRKVGLVMLGGLLEHEAVYANVVNLKILKLLPQVDVRDAMHSAAYGAVLMAIERLNRS